ncbi:MAG: FtsQ-type POTRA domain-containing protein [Candidatus Omnitrophota bacterium]|jgi:hypothetical protein
MARKRRRKFKQFNLNLHPKVTWISVVVVLAAAGVFVLLHFAYNCAVFTINEDTIMSNIAVDKTIVATIKKESLFSLDVDTLAADIQRKHPEYEDVYIVKKFPSTVNIKIKKRRALAQIKGKLYYPLDDQAVIVDKGSLRPLEGLIPVEITGHNDSFAKGYKIKDERLDKAFSLIKTLRKENFLNEFSVKLINAADLQAIYFLIESLPKTGSDISATGEIKVIVGEDDFKNKIGLLKEVVNSRLKDRLSSVKYIDLRYKKVYVGFRR